MPILNYTTSVPAVRTISTIIELLANNGAEQIMTNYLAGVPTGIAFTISGRAFSLPVRVERVEAVLTRDRSIQPRFKTHEQAEKVAWRIAKDWLEAQLAIVATEMVTFEQVMLPYMHSRDGRTLYELFVADDLSALGTGA